MQETRIDVAHFDRLQQMERDERLAKIHHQHLGNGKVLTRQFYTGERDANIHAQMDAERRLIEQAGGTVTHRTKIGRNATCPCGSGSKFKKCCMAGARVINTR